VARGKFVVGSVSFALLLCLLPALAVGEPGSYRNPVSKTFADTFADPAVIRAKDGYWYAYGTSDPLREGGEYHLLPTARSNDLVKWRYIGDAFDASNAPTWMADPEMWAPDINYFNGRYYLYYVVTNTVFDDHEFDTAIGVATAPTPAGPWTDSGAPVVGPRPAPEEPGEYLWTFDPEVVTSNNGTRFIYYGSYFGGIFVSKLSRNGLRTVGASTQVSINDRYEGAYVVHRGGYYYLFASNADCCAGPTTGYSVFVGRSRSPRGPFRDRFGDTLTASRAGGTHVISPNGNRWVGTGHNSVVTDLAGQDWFVYHAIDRRDPYLDAPFEVNERPMLLDRLDWIEGWPTVRGGRWASDSPQTGPTIEWDVGSEFNDDDDLSGWRTTDDGWRLQEGIQARGFVRRPRASGSSYLTSDPKTPEEVRVEADLRLDPAESGGAAGIVAAYQGQDDHIVAWLDRGAGRVSTEVLRDGRVVAEIESALPRGFRYGTWHNVALDVGADRLRVEVTDARLHDPVVVQQLELPEAPKAGAIGVAARGTPVDADNVGGAMLAVPHDELAPDPAVGSLAHTFSDEFNDGTLEPEWDWVRAPAGDEKQGGYVWPTQDADLHQDSNSASVLLRSAPEGDYTVETKLTIDLGVDTDRSFQQAGLVVYTGDDLHLRLTHVAIFNTRQTEFLKEMPFAGGIADGAMSVGTPADTTWLRISHRRDPRNGEHEFRAASSRNGETWVWGGVWTLPERTRPRIGLVSMGGAGATAKFDYFRVHRP
jgi:arabinan endo-1,5-alpha-L-arabinosidase